MTEKKELSQEDQKRIKNCDFYLQTKNIIKSHEEYKDLNIGEVFFIKDVKWGRYESRSGAKPDKFMIFHKDQDNFVFVKRINASGKLGKEVICLTTQYPMPTYEIEPDPEYVDSIIFENEDGYDPLKAEKEYNKKKSKARRKNKGIEIKLKTHKEAYNYIKTLKVGDVLYDAQTAYGGGLVEWRVTDVTVTPVMDDPSGWGRTRTKHMNHKTHGFTDVVDIKLTPLSVGKGRRWGTSDRELYYDAFYKRGYYTYYKQKPYTPEDF